MTAAESQAGKVPAGETNFSQWCDKIAIVLDCTIPILLVAALAIGSGAMAFGFLN